MNKPFTGQTLVQRVSDYQSELKEAIDRGEQQEFIENFDGDLNQLLIDVMYALARQSTAGAA